MPDIFDQEGITFFSSQQASTHPTAVPDPIAAPSVDMANAPANQTIQAVQASDLQPNSQPINGGSNIPLPPDPTQLAANLAGNGNAGVSAAAGVAPPQPQARAEPDIFDKEGIDSAVDNNAFNRGVYIPSRVDSTIADPAAAYAQHQQVQNQTIAAARFTPDQLKSFTNNPLTMAEAIQGQNDWPDVPAILQKQQAGEPLTTSQSDRLNEYIDTVVSHNVRGMSWNGDKALLATQLPAEAIHYVSSGTSGNLTIDNEQSDHTDIGGNVIMPAPYAPKVGEKVLNDYAAVTDKGQQVMAKSKEEPVSSALKSSAYLSQDVANDPMNVKTPLISSINDLPASVRSALYDTYKAQNPQAQASKVFTPSGWTKMVDGLGETEVSKIMKQTLALEMGLVTAGDKATEAFAEGMSQPDPLPISEQTGPTGILTASAVDWAHLIAIKAPSAIGGAAIAGISSLVGTLGGSEERAQRELTGMMENEMGRSGVGASDAAPIAAKPHVPTYDEVMPFLTPAKDQAMVNAGIVSVEGGRSTATVAAENILVNKGVDAAQAEEVVANMTANEKDNFVAQSMPKVESEYPRQALPPEIVSDMPPAELALDEAVPAPQTVYFDGEISRGQLDKAEEAAPPPIDDSESMFNTYYRAMHHAQAAAEIPYKNAVKAGAKIDRLDNTPMLIALNHQIPMQVDYYVNKATFSFDKEGYPVETGKSLKAIMDDFDNTMMKIEPKLEGRRQDFKDYLLARHYEALTQFAKDVEVTQEQIAKSQADLARLNDKYGPDAKFFQTFGDEFVAFRKRTRDLLVGTLLTKEQRAIEDKRYPYSIPLKRELDKKEYEDAVASGDYAGLNPGSLTKRLKGSALPVKDIIESTLRETARTIDFVQRNRVGNSIYNLREHAPTQVQVTERPSVKKGTAVFEHAYDPKLRDKLQKLAEMLGSDVKRVETVTNEKGAHGAYDFTSKDIFVKHGSTEGTLTHEVGHLLDDVLDLKTKLLGDKDIKKELQKLAEDRLHSEVDLQTTPEGRTSFVEQFEKNSNKYKEYVKQDREVLANFFDAWVNSPDRMRAEAPKAASAFEKIIDENPKFAALREVAPSTARKTEKIKKDVFGRGDIPPNSFPFWKDGKEVLLKVSKPMYQSLSSMRPSQLNMAEKFFTKGLRVVSGAPVLRWGATSTPEFAARNTIKDTLEASVQSGVGYNPLYASRSLYGILTKDKGYQDFIKSGGKFGEFMALGEKDIEDTFSSILNPKSKFRQLVSNPMHALEVIPQTSEQITRYGVYRAAIDKGFTPVEAAHYALDATLQFPRGGSISKKYINPVVPFFNVGLLATEKLVRAFKDDPVTMTVRGSVFLTAPAVIAAGYYLYGSDAETRQAWLEIPIDTIASGMIPYDYNKATGEWRYIPTPYALGYMFAGMPMLALRQMQADAPDDGRAMWQHVLKGFMGSISPINDASSVIPPSVKVALEDTANFDYFRGREIYSKYKEGDATLNQDKTNPYDSETAKLIGKHFDVSPSLFDHTVRGIFGGAGGYGLRASDTVINGYRRANGETVPEKPTNNVGGPLGAFTLRAPEGYRSNSYQKFQSNFLQASAMENHVKNMGSTADGQAYAKQNAVSINQLSQLKDAHKQIAAEGKAIAAIYSDPKMSGDEKAAQIRIHEKSITKIARQANNQYNAAQKGR